MTTSFFTILKLLRLFELCVLKRPFLFVDVLKNEMDEVLLAIPAEVLRDQVFPFLSLKELVCVDTAVCDKRTRSHFLTRFEFDFSWLER